MKTLAKNAFTFKKSFILPTLIINLNLILINQVTTQTFTTLHSFTATNPQIRSTNNNKTNPYSLLLSNKTLYKTTHENNSSTANTVFAVNTNDTSFTTLHSFTDNDDANYSYTKLILSNNTLYKTTYMHNNKNAD